MAVSTLVYDFKKPFDNPADVMKSRDISEFNLLAEEKLEDIRCHISPSVLPGIT